MSFTLRESEIELAALDWLRQTGYATLDGAAIAPDAPTAERESFQQVVLRGRLRAALMRLNPHLPAEALDDAYRKITVLRASSLVANNRSFHRMLVNGVPVEYARADEAHRSQYGFAQRTREKDGELIKSYGLAKYLRDALPNASFIGFTGTPIELDDANTRQVFGSYVDVYDIQQSVQDKATVPLYYEGRAARIYLTDEIKPILDEQFDEVTEGEEAEAKEALKGQWATLEVLVGDKSRRSPR